MLDMTHLNSSHRRLVLADVENLLGTASPSHEEVVQIRQEVLDILGDVSFTHFEVACSHRAAAAVRFGFPEGRHQWRSGPNGADLALLDVLAIESGAARFVEVVFASGDGIFAAAAAELTARGVRCTVISRRTSLSARLCLAAAEVFYLDDPISDEAMLRAA